MFDDYKVLYKYIALLVLLIVVIFITSKIQEWRYQEIIASQKSYYEQRIAEVNRVANAKLIILQAERQQLEQHLSQIEAEQYQELQNAKSKNEQLISDLANERRRLSVKTTNDCTASSSGLSKTSKASSMDNGATRAYIDPGDAAAIIRITDRGDKAIRQLIACQAYIKEVVKD